MHMSMAMSEKVQIAPDKAEGIRERKGLRDGRLNQKTT